jgi:hypothetical protein
MRAAALATLICTLLAAAPAGAAAGEPVAYAPPVDAPIVDPFREPDGPYGRGNRGIEYDTDPGAAVRAIGAGEVVFAGPVAGALHVTVLHPDGLRSSYSFLASISARRGARVAVGAVVGRAGDRLHLGVRRGDQYIDPALLFQGRVEVRVRLVPQGVDDGAGLSEVAALAALVRDRGGPGFGQRAWSWLADRGRDAVGATVRRLDPRRHPIVGIARAARAVTASLLGPHRPCTPAGTRTPSRRGRRVAVLVGGFGSTSDDAAIDDVDTSALGYAAGDVLRFSYAGGRTPDPSDGLDIPASPYGARATQADLESSARALADLIVAVAAAVPGAVIDVVGHSQGGVLARLALVELDRRGTVPPAIDLVVMLGAPHAGAPLAGAVAALKRSVAGDVALDAVARLPGVDLDADEPSPAQLAPGSAALAAGTLPSGVRGLAIAARTDLVVPSPSARVERATNVVVAVDGVSAHDALPGAPETHRELALAIAGLPPSCESRWDRTLDAVAGGAIAAAEGVVSHLLFAG